MIRRWSLALVVALLLGLTACAAAKAQDAITVGIVLVGPQNDRGWSQAHYEGIQYAAEQTGAEVLVFERLNPGDAPETTLRDVVTEFVDQGATLIITNSDDFKAETHEVAAEFPDVTFIHISGDGVLTDEAPANVGNIMGQMEWAKMMAGCAAALTTETGQIGYLGPLINNETRRLTASAYLGARYCWENYREMDAAELDFSVTWIGFWFNIPGVTLDPTEEANTFFDSGVDVLISGIDTTEAIVVAGQRNAAGEAVYAVPYDYLNACDEAPAACLGVPYFNWGPAYTQLITDVQAGTWERSWDWLEPDWSDLNNLETSHVGFVTGEGLSEDAAADLEDFITMLADFATNDASPDTFALWEGPLNLQDGTPLAADGEFVDALEVWYLPQLLEGMEGASS